jgi:hypothetical protein
MLKKGEVRVLDGQLVEVDAIMLEHKLVRVQFVDQNKKRWVKISSLASSSISL